MDYKGQAARGGKIIRSGPPVLHLLIIQKSAETVDMVYLLLYSVPEKNY